MSTTTLETPAWLMRSVSAYGATEGALKLDQGRLSFHESGEESPIFDVVPARRWGKEWKAVLREAR